MPFDFDAVIHKEYDIVPVPRSFITSNGILKPQIMWVGCSDSLVLETLTIDVLPEEIFVHRNLGNILSNGDLSSESAVAWSVDLLKVRCSSGIGTLLLTVKVDHIIVCGHYGCGLTKEENPKALYGWSKCVITRLRQISRRLTTYRDITKLHKMNDKFLDELNKKFDETSRDHRLEEVYTLAETDWLKKQPNVKAAIRDRGLQIHAFVYDKDKNACVRLVEPGNRGTEKI
jgi:carbonic anhydrase